MSDQARRGRRDSAVDTRIGALHRNGEYAGDLLQRRWDAVLEEVHEGVDGGESGIACAGAVAEPRALRRPANET